MPENDQPDLDLPDNDVIVLEDAQAAAFELDKQLRLAIRRFDLAAVTQLKPQADAAFDALGLARLELLKEDVLCTDEDVLEMRRIRARIDQAAETQGRVQAAIRFIGFLRKFAPV